MRAAVITTIKTLLSHLIHVSFRCDSFCDKVCSKVCTRKRSLTHPCLVVMLRELPPLYLFCTSHAFSIWVELVVIDFHVFQPHGGISSRSHIWADLSWPSIGSESTTVVSIGVWRSMRSCRADVILGWIHLRLVLSNVSPQASAVQRDSRSYRAFLGETFKDWQLLLGKLIRCLLVKLELSLGCKLALQNAKFCCRRELFMITFDFL